MRPRLVFFDWGGTLVHLIGDPVSRGEIRSTFSLPIEEHLSGASLGKADRAAFQVTSFR